MGPDGVHVPAYTPPPPASLPGTLPTQADVNNAALSLDPSRVTTRANSPNLRLTHPSGSPDTRIQTANLPLVDGVVQGGLTQQNVAQEVIRGAEAAAAASGIAALHPFGTQPSAGTSSTITYARLFVLY